MEQSENLKMYKPSGDDIVDIEVLNENIDILDAAIEASSEKTEEIREKIGAKEDYYPAKETLFGMIRTILSTALQVSGKFDESNGDSYICGVENALEFLKEKSESIVSAVSDYSKINEIATYVKLIKNGTDRISDLRTDVSTLKTTADNILAKNETVKSVVTGSKEITGTGTLLDLNGQGSGEIDLQIHALDSAAELKVTIDGGNETIISPKSLIQPYAVSGGSVGILQGLRIKSSLKIEVSKVSVNGLTTDVKYTFKKFS